MRRANQVLAHLPQLHGQPILELAKVPSKVFKDLRLCVNCPTSFEENQTVLKYLPERRTSHCFQVSVAADCEKSSNCDSKETQMVNDSLANTGSVSHPFIRSFFHQRRRSSIPSGNTPLCPWQCLVYYCPPRHLFVQFQTTQMHIHQVSYQDYSRVWSLGSRHKK